MKTDNSDIVFWKRIFSQRELIFSQNHHIIGRKKESLWETLTTTNWQRERGIMKSSLILLRYMSINQITGWCTCKVFETNAKWDNVNTTGCIDYLDYTKRTKNIQQIDNVLARVSHHEKSFIIEKEKIFGWEKYPLSR